MRIALAGKGGAGKTTVSAALARIWAAAGADVVAIDADANPNLAAALGMGRAVAAGLRGLPPSAVSRRLDGGPALTTDLDDLLEEHGAIAPGGVRLVLMGMPAHAEEGCLCSAHAIVSAVMADHGNRPETVLLIDMEASPEHFSRGTARHTDVLLLITEPYWRSLETTRRMAALAAELPIPVVAVVGNKVRTVADAEVIHAFCTSHDLELLGTIPKSDTVLDADAGEVAFYDAADAADATLAAIHAIRDRLDALAGQAAGCPPHGIPIHPSPALDVR
jgi:CO dehydrogenase maturation factor